MSKLGKGLKSVFMTSKSSPTPQAVTLNYIELCEFHQSFVLEKPTPVNLLDLQIISTRDA